MKNSLTLFSPKLVNSVVESIFDDFYNDAFWRDRVNHANWSKDKDGNYVVSYNVAGYKKSDIKVELENNTLFIDIKNDKWGQKTYSTTIPSEIDTSKVSATVDDGILSITLGVEEPKKRRQIQLQ